MSYFEQVETFKILVLLTEVFPTTDATVLSIFYGSRKMLIGIFTPGLTLLLPPQFCGTLISNGVSESLNFLI